MGRGSYRNESRCLRSNDTVRSGVIRSGCSTPSTVRPFSRDASRSEFHLIYLLPLAAGFAFGALRGMTIRLFERDGHLWQRYTPWTLLVWVTSLGASVGMGLLIGGHAPTQLSIGVSMLGELCVIGAKALNTGIPFAPDKSLRDQAQERFYGRHGSS